MRFDEARPLNKGSDVHSVSATVGLPIRQMAKLYTVYQRVSTPKIKPPHEAGAKSHHNSEEKHTDTASVPFILRLY